MDPYLTTEPPSTEPPVPMPETGWRILGFGAHEHIARAIQDGLRSAGIRATTIGLSDDADGDARLEAALARDTYDGVAIGGFISGQDPIAPATEETSLWFNRVLNLVHTGAGDAKLILVRGPSDAMASITRVLGDPG
ncbi:MAG: hypothetical protein JWM47_3714 [Acidimicrobiales bacterium]|nr:hypothetical protein [Acidimicrobiales bacterium]